MEACYKFNTHKQQQCGDSWFDLLDIGFGKIVVVLLVILFFRKERKTEKKENLMTRT